MTIHVLLADDHEMFRSGLRALLEIEPDIAVVGEAGDGLTLLRLADERVPDVVCMDVNMPHLDGIAATRQLVASHPRIKVIAVSGLVDRSYVVDMLSAGAVGYVAKTSAGDDLRKAIQAAMAGKTYLCPAILEVVTDQMRSRLDKDFNPLPKLGARELQVLRLVASGLTSVEVAERMQIAVSTVEVHRRNVMHKLGLRGVADLTRYAIRNGLVSSHD